MEKGKSCQETGVGRDLAPVEAFHLPFASLKGRLAHFSGRSQLIEIHVGPSGVGGRAT